RGLSRKASWSLFRCTLTWSPKQQRPCNEGLISSSRVYSCALQTKMNGSLQPIIILRSPDALMASTSLSPASIAKDQQAKHRTLLDRRLWKGGHTRGELSTTGKSEAQC